MHNHTTSVAISGKKHAGRFMLIDTADLPLLGSGSVNIGSHGYPVITRVKTKHSVHRLIMTPSSEQVVDHINGDRLDNRKQNLRICTTAQNAKNVSKRRTSMYKGVVWNRERRHYKVMIFTDKALHYLGSFDDPLFASEVYDAAVLKHHKDFARPNHEGGPTERALTYLQEWYGPRWRATSPEGEVSLIDSLRAFCSLAGLNRPSMVIVSQKKQPRHKGWNCERISKLPTRHD